MSIAKHYETGEPLPEEVYQKLLAARTFRAGSFSLRQVCFVFLRSSFVSLSGLFFNLHWSLLLRDEIF